MTTLNNYKNLTQLQKTAILGELAVILSFAKTNADLKLRIYQILKNLDDSFKLIVLEAIKDTVSLSEEEVMQLYYLTLDKATPVFLWVDKVINDIDIYINASEFIYSSSKLALDKKEIRKNIIKSAFVMFIRKALFISPFAVSQLVNKILEDSNLDFLHPICIYLQEGCVDMMNYKYSEDRSLEDVSEDILSLNLDVQRIMSFGMETHSLEQSEKIKTPKENESLIHNMLNNLKAMDDFYDDEDENEENNDNFNNGKNGIIISKSIIIDKETAKEISGDKPFSEFMEELLNGAIKLEDGFSKKKFCYTVQKVFKNTNETIDIKDCKSEEEAIKYIQNIKEKYPELGKEKAFEFIIHKKEI